MGSRFDISVVANNQIEADSHIDTAVNEIRRIENLISSWMPTLLHQLYSDIWQE